jgi:hypothetical protein
MYLEKSFLVQELRFVDSSLERLVKVSGLFQTVIYYYAKDVESHKHRKKESSWNSLQSLESTIRIPNIG